MGWLGGQLGSLAGMAVDPLFWGYAAILFVLASRKLWLLCFLAYIGSLAIHFLISWEYWIKISGYSGALDSAQVIAWFRLLWTIIIIGIVLTIIKIKKFIAVS